jgi:hypothetical protein
MGAAKCGARSRLRSRLTVPSTRAEEVAGAGVAEYRVRWRRRLGINRKRPSSAPSKATWASRRPNGARCRSHPARMPFQGWQSRATRIYVSLRARLPLMPIASRRLRRSNCSSESAGGCALTNRNETRARDVRRSVAVLGKPDMAWQPNSVENNPTRKWRQTQGHYFRKTHSIPTMLSMAPEPGKRWKRRSDPQ